MVTYLRETGDIIVLYQFDILVNLRLICLLIVRQDGQQDMKRERSEGVKKSV